MLLCGLKVVAMPEHLAAGFHALCRVPDTNFSRISAALLFDLRARASTLESVAAFHALCARGGLDMRTAQLFDNAVGHRSNGKVCKDYGDLVLIDKPLATALHMAAERMHSAFGGTVCWEARLHWIPFALPCIFSCRKAV